MNNDQAIARLRKRIEYVENKILELQAESRPTYNLERDLEAFNLSLAALTYVRDLEVYEASQHQQQ